MRNVYILSAYRGKYGTATNKRRHARLLALIAKDRNLRLIGECIGSYQGEIERSCIVRSDTLYDVRILASRFDQESILFVNSHRLAHLIFCDQPIREEYLGVWECLGRRDAIRENPELLDGGFTLYDGQVWIASQSY